MKNNLWFTIALLVMLFVAAPAWAETVTLSADNPAEILIPEASTPTERYAAKELSGYLGKILGCTIPVRSAATPTDGVYPIVVGWHPLNQHLAPEKLKLEEAVVEATPERISLVGGRSSETMESEAFGVSPVHDRGTLYAVYDLLESFGVRWYRPESWGEYVPRQSSLAIPLGQRKSLPEYRYRYGISIYNTFHNEPEELEMVRRWAVRNRMNTNTWVSPEQGGYLEVDFSHAYLYLVPHEEYFAEHPEYFALINGQRSTSAAEAQLCLGNPDLQNLVFEKVMEITRRRPHRKIISLEPNDGSMWCECELCKAMDDPNQKAGMGRGAGGVSMSNRVSRFNNLIAKRLAEQASGISVGWLAYNQHTDVPSRVKEFEPNTVVQIAPFAGTYSDYSKKLHDRSSPQNQRLLKILEGYRKRTGMMAREYWSFYQWPGPLPLIHTMTDRLRSYRKYNFQGAYSETHPCWGPQGIDLYFYTWLLRNPDGDVQAEKNRYYTQFYGPAAKPMGSYHEMLEKAASTGPYYGSGGSRIEALFTRALLNQLKPLIERAQAAVQGDEIYEKRVAGVAAGYQYASLMREFLDQQAKGDILKAKASLEAAIALFHAFPDGSVFDSRRSKDGTRNWDANFERYRAQVDRQAGVMILFEEPKVLQKLERNWQFNPDPESKGTELGWEQPAFSDALWKRVDSGKTWQEQGFADYHGVGWYRRSFPAPTLAEGHRLILFFEMVDGHAEIYLNGSRMGEHILGPNYEGYNEPFYFDITDLLKVKQDNHLVVRVRKDRYVAGLTGEVALLQVKSVRPPQ